MRAAPLLLLLICSLTFFAGLGRAAVGDSDEAFYAESAREMIERGDWLTPHYNYERRFQKPILYYWLTATTYLVAGVGPATARLWSALSGVGLVFIAWWLGRRWYSDQAGLMAGLIVATSFGAFSMARLALPDLPLAFFATVTIAVLIVPARLKSGTTTVATRPPSVGVPGFSRAWAIAAIAAALGFLTKGPLAVLLPALVLLPVFVVERRLRELSWRTLLPALVVFAAIALPWYAAMTLEHGTAYLYGFFVGDNLERFATDRFNEPRPLWFYLPIVAGGLMPWTPFALLWIRPMREWISSPRRPDSRIVRLAIWILLPLAFFSISVGKQPRYIMPLLVPLAILLGASIADALETRRPGVVFRVSTALIAALLLVLALLLWRARSLAVDSPVEIMAIACGAMAAAGSAILFHLRSSTSRGLPFTLAGAAVMTLLALHYSVLSPAGPEPVERVADVLRGQRTRSEPTATYHVLVRNLIFYARFPNVDLADPGRLAAFLDSSDRVLCVLPVRVLQEYETARSKRLPRLAEVPYFNVSTVRLKALLQPDPKEDVETIVVVSNK